jgi:selenide,water dikinase
VLQHGDRILITGALGTGVLLHADMMGRARGPWIQSAFEAMQRSQGLAGRIALQQGAHGCTDITGFGLAGHLLTLLPEGLTSPQGDGLAASRGADRCSLVVDVGALPALPGAVELLDLGLRSTAHALNRLRIQRMHVHPEAAAHPKFELFFDPQTCGGLLIVVAADRAVALCDALEQNDIDCRTLGVVRVASESGSIGDASAAPLEVRLGSVERDFQPEDDR